VRGVRGRIRISFSRHGFVFAMDFRSVEEVAYPNPIASVDAETSLRVPPLCPGKYDKGGRNTDPLPPRPDVRRGRWGSPAGWCSSRRHPIRPSLSSRPPRALTAAAHRP
jgi:hypothetical protein